MSPRSSRIGSLSLVFDAELAFEWMLGADLEGNVVPYVRSADEVVRRGREFCKDSKEPFSINVVGQKVYFILSPADALVVLQGNPDISHDDHMRFLLRVFGGSPGAIDHLYQTPSLELQSSRQINSRLQHKPLAVLAFGLIEKELLAPDLSRNIHAKFWQSITRQTLWDSIPPSAVRAYHAKASHRDVSLLRWSQCCVLEGVITAFFGEVIWTLSPTLLDDVTELNVDYSKILFQLPKSWAPQVHLARERLLDCFVRYLHLPQSQKADQSWSVRTVESELRSSNIEDKDKASLLLMMSWGLNTNTSVVGFWMLAHMCSNPDVYAACMPEIDAAVARSESSEQLTRELEKSPYFSAFFYEVLRIVNNSGADRIVLRDTVVNGRRYDAGARIVLPFRHIAMDEGVFGADLHRLRPDRFLNAKGLERNGAFLPFAGGKRRCPGRFALKKASMLFTALAAHRFHIRPMGPLPAMEFGKPHQGPLDPVRGGDVIAAISPRDEPIS